LARGAGLSAALPHRRDAGHAREGAPAEAARQALPAGAVLANREGHQCTRHTISFHAPDESGDEGVLLRQAQIEQLEARCENLARDVEAARARLEESEAASAARADELAAAREEVAARQKAQHDAQIEQVKLAQQQERY